MEGSHPFLVRKVEHIVTSDEFLHMCKQNRFTTIGEIVEYDVAALLKKPGFNMHILMELITILKGNKLEHLLKEGYYSI